MLHPLSTRTPLPSSRAVRGGQGWGRTCMAPRLRTMLATAGFILGDVDGAVAVVACGSESRVDSSLVLLSAPFGPAPPLGRSVGASHVCCHLLRSGPPSSCSRFGSTQASLRQPRGMLACASESSCVPSRPPGVQCSAPRFPTSVGRPATSEEATPAPSRAPAGPAGARSLSSETPGLVAPHSPRALALRRCRQQGRTHGGATKRLEKGGKLQVRGGRRGWCRTKGRKGQGTRGRVNRGREGRRVRQVATSDMQAGRDAGPERGTAQGGRDCGERGGWGCQPATDRRSRGRCRARSLLVCAGASERVSDSPHSAREGQHVTHARPCRASSSSARPLPRRLSHHRR